MNNFEISVQDLKRKLDAHEEIQILDVRSLSEYQFFNIGGIHIPLQDLQANLEKLDSSKEIAALCRIGGRSAQAVFILEKAGFKKVYNVIGGINAWSAQIDPNVPSY